MVRKLVLSAAIAAMAFPALAYAEEAPASARGLEVRADDGTVLGQVGSVERNARGQIVSVQVAGLEPADAPAASSDLVASRNDLGLRVRFTPEEAARRGVSSRETRIR